MTRTSARTDCSAGVGYNHGMARVRAILCVALAGCYSPGYVDCEVTCASGQCPDGLACRAGVCRVGDNAGPCSTLPEDGGPGDGPSSDVPPGVADEDLDGMPDSTDPCPISANNTDTDLDGVGDACEPIAAGMDTLIRFEGFHATTAPAAAQVMGNWTYSGGAAHVTAGANVAASITFPLATAGTVRTTVVAKVRVDGPLVSTPDATSVGVVSRTDGNTSGIVCGIGRDPATSTDAIMLLKIAAAADANFRSIAGLASINTSAVISVTRNPSNEIYSCGVATSVIAFTAPAPAPSGTRAGIRVRSMNATFEWLMIFETR